jgi:hypothetical protein
MRCALAPAAVVLALALAGCGGQGRENTDSAQEFTGEQKAVATTVEDLQKAAKERDGRKICGDLITAKLRDAISDSNCGEAVDDAIRETDEVDLEVTKVTISGTTATALVEEETGEDESRTRTLELEKAAGRWRIAELPPR